MSGFLVDTNVISEFTKPRPESRVIRWLDAADPESMFVSVVTFGEVRLGIEDLPAGKLEEVCARSWEQHPESGDSSHIRT